MKPTLAIVISCILAPLAVSANAVATSANAVAAKADATQHSQAVVNSAAAGSLAAGALDASTTSLTVTGEVNAADLYAIGNTMSSLSSLDLSGATITAYDSSTPINGACKYAAGEIPVMAFMGLPISSLVLPTAPVSIGAGAFAATALTAVDLSGANITAIGDGAFQHCLSLETAKLGDAPCGVNTFYGCTALQTVTVASTVTDGQFGACTSLATVANAEHVTTIGKGAFKGCTSLGVIDLGDCLTTIGASAFEGSGLTAVQFTDNSSLTTVGDRAFASCHRLAGATFGDATASLGTGVFFDCPSLSSVTLPGAMSALADHSFAGDKMLRDINIGDTDITSIGEYALYNTSSVTTLTLPAEVVSLGDGAMEGMTGLTTVDVTALGEVPALGTDVFAGIDQANVSLLVSIDNGDEFAAADQWKEFKINRPSSSKPAVVEAVRSSGVYARFEGMNLQIESRGADLTGVSVYSLDGTALLNARAEGTSFVADTSDLSGSVFIVTATTADNRRHAIKILR